MDTSAHKRGFTLVELLVVISIIAILAVVGITVFSGVQKNARDAKRRGDLHAISLALEQYKQSTGVYPMPSDGAWSSHAGWTLSAFGLTNYMQSLPVDPQNVDLGGCESVANCHLYRYCSDGTFFVLMVNLENPPSVAQANPVNCSIGGPNRYWIQGQQ